MIEFIKSVIKNVFTLKPAALVATAIQFAIFLGLAKLAYVYCSFDACKSAREASAPGTYELVTGLVPSVAIWAVATALSFIVLILGVVVFAGGAALYVALPLLVFFGGIGVGSLLPSPLNAIVGVGSVVVTIWILIRRIDRHPPPPNTGGPNTLFGS